MQNIKSKFTAFLIVLLLICSVFISICGALTIAQAQGGYSTFALAATEEFDNKFVAVGISVGSDYKASEFHNTGITLSSPSQTVTHTEGDSIRFTSTRITIDFTNARLVYPVAESNVLESYIDSKYDFSIIDNGGNKVWTAIYRGWSNNVSDTVYYAHEMTINNNIVASKSSTSINNIQADLSIFDRSTITLSQGSYSIKVSRSYTCSQISPKSFVPVIYKTTSVLFGGLYIDTEAPTITMSGKTSTKEIKSGDYVNERVRIYVDDNNFSKLFYKTPLMNTFQFIASPNYTTPSIQGMFYFYGEDAFGNKSPVVNFFYDNIAPIGNIISQGVKVASGTYIKTDFKYAATDDGSGIVNYSIKTPKSVTYESYSPERIITNDNGDGWYSFYSEDKCGNVSDISTIFLEATAPLVSIYRNGQQVYTKNVTQVGTFETHLYYNIGDTFKLTCETSSGNVSSNFTLNTTITITDTFPKEFEFKITDSLGNTAIFKAHVAKKKPKLIIDNIEYDSGQVLYHNSDKTLKWYIDTGWNGSNIKITSHGNKNVDETVYFASGVTDYTLITDDNSETTYKIAITDAALNTSNYTVHIDKLAPTGVIISDGKPIEDGGYSNKPVCIEFTEDSLSAQYSINGGEYNPYQEGQYLTADAFYSFLIKDLAGNKTLYTVTIDTIAPTGQLYADYVPVPNGSVTNGRIFFTWDDATITATANGVPYQKNTVLSDNIEYTFVLTDLAHNSITYRITVDNISPSYNADKLNKDKNYLISKWFVVTYSGYKYSFPTYEEALSFTVSKEFERNVTTLILDDINHFTQNHLVASNGNPDNHADEVREGEYWLYKSKANPNTMLYYFDYDLLQVVMAEYSRAAISNANYFMHDGNDYGKPSNSMYDNLWSSADGTTAPLGNNFVFERRDSCQIYAELVGGANTRIKVAFDIPFGQQFSINGLYRLIEIDEAKNETVYFLYLDLLPPDLNITATIFGSKQPIEMTINEEVLAGIAAYYYERFAINHVVDADKWAILSITFSGKTSYYANGDALPILNYGGEYIIGLYDRAGNAYEFKVYIVGDPALLTFVENADKTALELSISLSHDFDTIVALEIRRNGKILQNITTDTLFYIFDKGGDYTVLLRDNFGRIIERQYTFIKSLPNGSLSGVDKGGKTKTDINFVFDKEKYYAIVLKDNVQMLIEKSGSILISATNENSGCYVVKLINLKDEDNYSLYDFTMNTLSPEVSLNGVKNNDTTNSDVTVVWQADDIISATYSLNGNETPIKSGQKFTAEGSYTITVTNDLGTTTTLKFTIDKTLDYTLTVGEEIVDNVDTTNQTITVFNNEPLHIFVLKNGEPIDYVFGNVLFDEGVYAVRITDDFGNAANFIMTIDRSVSYSANIANGLMSNGGVIFTNGEKLTATVLRDGKVIDYSFGQSLDEEGCYIITLRDVYGNERTVGFQLANGVKQLIDYTLGDNATILSVIRNGESYPHLNGNRLNFTDDGEYKITAEADGIQCIFSLRLDTIAPSLTLVGVKNGGVADGTVTITEPSENSSITVYKNGEKIDYEFGQALTDYGQYRVLLRDEAGNVSEYSFTLKHVLNGGAVAIIIIGIVSLLAAAVFVFLARRGLFKSKIKGAKAEVCKENEDSN